MRDPVALAAGYAAGVLAGEIPAGKWVRLAAQRWRSDLAASEAPGARWAFDPARARRACAFVENLPHVKGKWAGGTLVLEPWQCFFFANVFGWVEAATGLRRYRRAFVLIPRKNGKTTLAAALGLLMLTEEAEPGAEIYCGATSEEQADEVFRPAKAMASRAEGFCEHYGVTVAAQAIFRDEGLSRFVRLIGKPGEGQSPSCAIHDEYHEHKTSAQVDAMDLGMGARQEPLQLIITTAGTDISSPCKEMDDYMRQVLEGVLPEERTFALVYAADPEDDWEDFDTWRRCNPNLGVSVSEEYLQGKLAEAKQRPARQNVVRCKHLNQWMHASTAWLDASRWLALGDRTLRIERFAGERCWLGLDLASKIDVCALMALFRHGDGWALFGRYYLPSDTVELPHNEHYQRWVGEGWMTATDGARTDFRVIEDDLREFAGAYAVEQLAFDPREAGYLIAEVQGWASFECVEVPQGPAHMSQPMKEFEALVADGKLRHNGDPVLAWMVANTVKKQGRGGGPVKYYYPTKEREGAKIDGVVAAIMALSRALLGDDDVYNRRARELPEGETLLRTL